MTTCNRRWIIHRVVRCIIRGDDIITATRSPLRENDAHNNCVLCVCAELESILLQFFPRFGSFCPQHYFIDAAVKHLFPFVRWKMMNEPKRCRWINGGRLQFAALKISFIYFVLYGDHWNSVSINLAALDTRNMKANEEKINNEQQHEGRVRTTRLQFRRFQFSGYY